jgi:hypothetical protein
MGLSIPSSSGANKQNTSCDITGSRDEGYEYGGLFGREVDIHQTTRRNIPFLNEDRILKQKQSFNYSG